MAGTAIQENKTTSSSPVPNPNATANNGSAEVLFSPTSAAAWALSTLHNFGAAAPTENGQRPSTDSLTGTRLFNNAGVSNPDSVHTSAVTSGSNQFSQNIKSGISVVHTQATTGVTWGQTQFQSNSSVSRQ